MKPNSTLYIDTHARPLQKGPHSSQTFSLLFLTFSFAAATTFQNPNPKNLSDQTVILFYSLLSLSLLFFLPLSPQIEFRNPKFWYVVLCFFLCKRIMGETRENDAYEEELLDYDEEEDKAPDSVAAKVNGESGKKSVFVLSV